MHLLRSTISRIAVLAIIPLTLGGCDVLGPQDDLSGYYDYAGTVHDSPGHSVNGQLDIRQGYSSNAEVDIDWNFYEGSQRVVHVVTSRTVPATVLGDGTIRFTVEGQLQLSDGSYTNFTLTHDARRSGSRDLKGTWRLLTDLPSDDSGSFTASR